jgi:hypothetical protein
MWFIFNLHRESPFFYQTHTIHIITISRVHVIYKRKYTPSWKGGPLFMVENPYPPWSLALSQLPLCPLPSPHPCTCFPTNRTFIYIQNTLTCPLLLSCTIPTSYTFGIILWRRHAAFPFKISWYSSGMLAQLCVLFFLGQVTGDVIFGL